MTILFNGLVFVKSKKDLINTLFNPIQGKTAHGLYEKTSSGYKLYKPDGSLEAFIVDNNKQGRFIVSAYYDGTAERFMFGTATLTEEWLGIADLSCSEVYERIEGITVI